MDADPGAQIRAARERSGLTQRALAARSGVRQPNIAAYEAGRRSPTEETLQRLVDAARERPSTVLERHREAVIDVIEAHGGHEPLVFGSIVHGTDAVDSDIDLMVRFDEGTGMLRLAALTVELEELLGTRVDIIESTARGAAVERARREGVPV